MGQHLHPSVRQIYAEPATYREIRSSSVPIFLGGKKKKKKGERSNGSTQQAFTALKTESNRSDQPCCDSHKTPVLPQQQYPASRTMQLKPDACSLRNTYIAPALHTLRPTRGRKLKHHRQHLVFLLLNLQGTPKAQRRDHRRSSPSWGQVIREEPLYLGFAMFR